MKVLVVAPHPDDEVLGMGGTIARLASEGHHLSVATVTRGTEPLFSEETVARGRQEQARAHRILGVSEAIYLDLPAAGLDGLLHREINERSLEVVESTRPEWVFLPHGWDLHRDHREVFQSFLVALRPQGPGAGVRRIACYETVSETHWSAPGLEPGFHPQWYVDITSTLERKLEAVRAFASQVREYPHERSVEGVEAQARRRGVTVSVDAAEAFVIIRERS